jgi:hypothetical protein
MRHLHVLIASIFLTAACASSPADPREPLDPTAVPSQTAGCFAVQLGGEPSPDVSLPALIQLTREPAPGFVTPGRLAVREPGAEIPRAPISWWIPMGADMLELVLGGGYTGYVFSLRSDAGAGWTGEGTYFADMGLEPTPAALPLRLRPTTCP